MENNQKHFVVSVYTSTHAFTYECTEAYEALNAITDAAETFSFKIDADDVMQTLISMKNGITMASRTLKWGVVIEDNEVYL